MAKTQRDLKGWLYELQESNVNGSRRTRRQASNETMVLKREDDGMQIKPGDTILIQQTEGTEIAMIRDIEFGTSDFINLTVLSFVRATEFQGSEDPNELYITAYTDEISVQDIVDRVQVLCFEEYNQIGIDNSVKDRIYFCRKAANADGSVISEEFDFKEIYDNNKTNLNQFVETIKKLTIKKATKKHRKVTEVSKENLANCEVEMKGNESTKQENVGTPTNKEAPQIKTNAKVKVESFKIDPLPDSGITVPENAISSGEAKEQDDDHEEDGEEGEEDEEDEEEEEEEEEEQEEEEEDDDDDEEFTSTMNGSPRKRVKRTKSQQQSNKRTRAQKNNKSTAIDSPIGSPSPSPSKIKGGVSRESINTMLSPLKRRLRLKQDLTNPTISLSSQRKNKRVNVPIIDSTSEAFKQLKAKLHTSAKLASLPCREDEFVTVYSNLESAIQEETGCCLYVSGTPGVGKTVTIREVISELQSLVPLNELNDFDYLEINGLKLLNPQVAYEILWEKVSGLKVSASNSAVLLESYFNQHDPERKPLVVLMDELDQIVNKKQNVMYNFFNWPTYANSKLIVIAVANTMDLPERILSNKISSRLGLRRIQFIGYTFEQLGIIIKHRLEMVQTEKKVVVNPDAIGFASRKVASVSGDARRALTICRRAVEIAEREFKEANDLNDSDQVYHVQIKHISKAINETINSPVSHFLMSLPLTHKLLLVGLLLRMRRSGLAENSLSDIIDEMKNFVSVNDKRLKIKDSEIKVTDILYEGLVPSQDSIGSDNIRALSFKQALRELIENGIILQQNIKSERYRLIHLNISEEEVLTALKNDEEIGNIF